MDRFASESIPDHQEVCELIGVIRDGSRPEPERRAAQNRLVRGNLRLVLSIAYRFRDRGVDVPDLISEGIIGLIRAIKKYDPARGYQFGTYATYWVRSWVSDAVAAQSRTIRVPTYQHWLLGRFRRARERLTQELGRLPTDAEVIDTLPAGRLDLDLIHDSLRASRAEGTSTFIPGDRHDSPIDAATRSESRERLTEILRFIPRRHVDVLTRRNNGETLLEVARSIGVTRERVRQLETEAMDMARAVALGTHGGSISEACRARKRAKYEQQNQRRRCARQKKPVESVPADPLSS